MPRFLRHHRAARARRTNEWNFEKLENPPDYEPTHCAECGRVIRLAQGGYMMPGGDFICARCAGAEFF